LHLSLCARQCARRGYEDGYSQNLVRRQFWVHIAFL
jgi:hypothetical protein